MCLIKVMANQDWYCTCRCNYRSFFSMLQCCISSHYLSLEGQLWSDPTYQYNCLCACQSMGLRFVTWSCKETIYDYLLCCNWSLRLVYVLNSSLLTAVENWGTWWRRWKRQRRTTSKSRALGQRREGIYDRNQSDFWCMLPQSSALFGLLLECSC